MNSKNKLFEMMHKLDPSFKQNIDHTDEELTMDELEEAYEILENSGKFYEVDENDLNESHNLHEAEYKGRKVKLGKIMRGDVKKFKVYVKNDKGKVVKVNFGHGGSSAKKQGYDQGMKIKKNNPERRKAFRARHNCENPGPRWKPRYWACKTW